jgi:hypothetical protein
MRRRALTTVAALAAFATMAASCLSPTLPLPPPDAPESISGPNSTGLWQISGNCVAGAIVSVFNTNTGRGEEEEDLANTGTYSVTIAGTECDIVSVEQATTAGAASESTTFTLQAVSSGEAVNPNACP